MSTATLSLLETAACNSFQVMVYNTTDNRSSLNITDLTSDGDYSVTVAGRDGAGRIGLESEELKIRWTGSEISTASLAHLTHCTFNLIAVQDYLPLF